MNLCVFLCIVPFIPYLSGNSLPIPKEATKLSPNVTVKSDHKDLNYTKVTLLTEGGSVEPEILALPKENHSSLINVDKEMVNTKVKSIVPRKGVIYNPAEDVVPTANSTKERIDTTVAPKLLTHKINLTAEEPAQTNSSAKSAIPNNTILNSNNNTAEPAPTIHPVLPKKPTVLSAEAIMETEKRVQLEREKMGMPSKSIIAEQLPTSKVKYNPNNPSGHPGMVMPIVITMLVVPMFAVLGYMALRRGQEAWKNRHYKRMDFLLDGMYND